MMDGPKVREIKNKEIKKNKETIIDGSVISFRRNQVAWLELRREEAQHLVLCPEASVPLQGRHRSRGCIPD